MTTAFLPGEYGTVTLITTEHFYFRQRSKAMESETKENNIIVSYVSVRQKQPFIESGEDLIMYIQYLVIVMLDHTFCVHCKIEIKTSQQNNG